MIDPATRARLYHAQYQDYTRDLPFWLGLAKRTGSPILEMGCGTGRLVFALAKQGYTLIGLDHDQAMIEYAMTRVEPGIDPAIRWIHDDLEKISMNQPVHLAIGALNTFAYLDDASFSRALQAIKRILTDDGLVGLDLPPSEIAPFDEPSEDELLDEFIDHDADSVIEVRAKVRPKAINQVEVEWRYDEFYSDGSANRHIWDQVYYPRSIESLQRLIEGSGLVLHDMYGDYDLTALLEGSPRFLLVLGK